MTAQTRPILGLCMSVLAGQCDFANARDGAGFSASDAATGHRLAEKPEDRWTIAEKRAAHGLAIKYRRQLSAAGIDVNNLPSVPTDAPADAHTAFAPGPCSACGGRIERGALFVWANSASTARGARQHADASLCARQPSLSDSPVSDVTRRTLDQAGVSWSRPAPSRTCRVCRDEIGAGDLCFDCALDMADIPTTRAGERVRPSWRQWAADGRIGNPPVPQRRTQMTARHLLSTDGPIAKSLPGYREREPQLQLVDLAEQCIRDGEHAAAEAATGCIQADAEIIYNRGGNGRRIQLKRLVEMFNGGACYREGSSRAYRWNPEIPTYVQREKDGVVRLVRLVNAWRSGVKTTYTVTTDSGRQIRATAEHPFLTDRGWLQLRELEIGERVHVRGEQASGGEKVKPRYMDVYGLHAHPYAVRRKNGSASSYRHRLVAEARENGMSYERFVALIQAGHVDGLRFLDPAEFDVHHKDRNWTNDQPWNLQVLRHDEHARLHAVEGTGANVLYKVATEAVASIELYGEEETYDLEVADEPHNFIANGFVVHNTGKSLGYMVAGLASGHQCIASTADKSLQAQLVGKDVPFLQNVLPFNFTAALLKGRGNYVCRQRVAEINGDAQGRLGEEFAFRSAEAAQTWPALRQWIDDTDSGDLETVPFRMPGDLVQDVTVSSDECASKKCPFYGSCFAEQAKQKAQNADLVIVNHALLLRDADVRANTGGMAAILPNATVLLLDEAHHLADIARDNFGIEVTASRWTRIARRVERLTSVSKDASEADKATAERWSGRVAMITAQLTPALDAIKARVIEAKESAMRLGDETNELGRVATSFRRLADDMTDGRPSYVAGENDAEAWRKLAGAAERLADDVTALASSTGDRDTVRYAEMDGIGDRQRVKLICKPIDVADLLRERIFDRFDSVVSCSATIATNGRSFDFWKRETGCPSPRELVVGSPFDYPKQSMLYLPSDSAAFDPRNLKGEALDAYHARMADEIERLVGASKGGAFVLFTSYRMLNEMHRRLADKLGRKHLVLKHDDAMRPALVKAFREDGNAVLFGTKSFTEGVDISGDALRLVVIVGLPFAPPNDPMWEARCAAVERRGGKWFSDLALPTAIIALKQSVGRLIRSVDDRGVVAALDGRLDASRTKYGPQIVRSLPPMTPTRSLDAVSAFYGQ